MREITDLRARIIEFIKEHQLSAQAFAERAGLSPELCAGMELPGWNPLLSTLDRCLDYVNAETPVAFEEVEPVEYELPWENLNREHNMAFQECANLWNTLGQGKSDEILDLFSRHELGSRIALNRMVDNNRLLMEKFNPMIWRKGGDLSGVPISELPDKRFGKWAEESMALEYRINRPRLIFCRIPMETMFGKHIVSYTTLRLPIGEKAGAPERMVAFTRLENGHYKTLRDAHDAEMIRLGLPPEHPPTSPPRKPHLRLVKS